MTTRSRQMPSAMLKGLRVKFIAVNMALAALVLLVAFTTICALDHRSSLDEVYRSLNGAIERVSDDAQHQQGKDAPFALDPALQPGGIAQGRDDSFAPPQIGGKPDRDRENVPVAVYFASRDDVTQMMGKSSASVSGDILDDAIAQVLDSSAHQGYLRFCDLFFAKLATSEGVIVAFADGSAASGWQSLAWGLTGIGVVALLALFVFNLLFSRWALRPVQRAWQQQQQFVADASHELKTPLTVILANNAILQREGDKTVASQSQWIESTKLEAERMQGLVTDMLDLARSDADDTWASASKGSSPVQFSRLVEGEALSFESVAFDRGITWSCEVKPGLVVNGDAHRLQRLVAVLLDNACKYAPMGGAVSIELNKEGSRACLSVRNDGDPIDMEDLAHIFDRFYRADKARTDGEAGEAPNGYGLGLSIAQQIASEHKGTLEASSDAEKGTVFTLTLPLA